MPQQDDIFLHLLEMNPSWISFLTWILASFIQKDLISKFVFMNGEICGNYLLFYLNVYEFDGMQYLVFIGIMWIWLLPILFLELARDALNAEGYCVIGGYMSPVNDAYKKRVCSCLYHIDRNVTCRVAFVSKWMSFTFYTFLKTLKQMV